MLSLAIAVAISASIMRSVTTLNESRFKPQYFTQKPQAAVSEVPEILALYA